MSYQRASEILAELQSHITAANDPVSWDLSCGLIELSNSIAADMQQVKSQLARIEQNLSSLEK